MSRKIWTTLLVFAAGSLPVRASTITTIGPGMNAPTANDTAPTLSIVDTLFSQTLGPGSYAAEQFSYAFVDTTSNPLTGGVQPFLAVQDGANYKVIAVGDLVNFSTVEPYATHSFGGGPSAEFYLGSPTTVYAGFYWNGGSSPPEAPIGFANGGTNESFIYYGGANAPTVGSDLSASPDAGIGAFNRIYDFSVGVTIVPEPPSLVALLGAGVVGLLIAARVRRLR
jgi:hypothetical protein